MKDKIKKIIKSNATMINTIMHEIDLEDISLIADEIVKLMEEAYEEGLSNGRQGG